MRVAIALAFLAATRCGAPPTLLQTDVQAYLSQTKTWAPAESEASRTIDRILRTQFVDQAEVLQLIRDHRPHLLAHLQAIEGYKPGSTEVQTIHRRYVAAWKELQSGYEAIERGFGTADQAQLAQGREAMDGWRAGIGRVASDLRGLMQRGGVDGADATPT